jgi:GH15 family glucan-1,4-alpha-glucosidase
MIDEVLTERRAELVQRSLAILRGGQTESGAFIACPTFPVYRYCWFRDGTFVAQALDLCGDREAARRFYDWGCSVVVEHKDIVEEAISSPIGEVPSVYLHTRYQADGSISGDDWPNFQLDGFGTFLWGMADHVERGDGTIPASWQEAASLLARYLAHLWRSPNYDCWEEFPDDIHASTLCAIHGGLAAASHAFGEPDWKAVADEIKSYLQDYAAPGGWLNKSVGVDGADASTLWAAVPFSVFESDSQVVTATVEKVRETLEAPTGGVHRCAKDSYYGGGLWILLTATLGEVILERGDISGAGEVLRWIESHASDEGHLPEQIAYDLNVPDMYEPWKERWGSIASPLLWSHAAYLRLEYAYSERMRTAETEQSDERNEQLVEADSIGRASRRDR